MVVRTKLQANKSGIVGNQSEVKGMYVYLVGEPCLVQLIHAEVINLRHEVQDIPLDDSPTLIPKDDRFYSLNCSDDRIKHEDQRSYLEVIDRLCVVFK